MKHLYIPVALGLSVLLAQDAGFQFDVASVRVSAPLEKGVRPWGDVARGGPGTNDPGYVTYERTLFRTLLMDAYGVGTDRIKGPDWITTGVYGRGVLFDISAKVPLGATKAQVKVMLQSLLKERFRLAVHHETVQSSGFALVVAKRGPRLTESAGPARESERGQVNKSGQLPDEKDGFPELFPGANMGGNMKGGTVRVRFRDYPLFDLSQQLSFMMNVRIVDKTGLNGKYDFTLEFTTDPVVGIRATSPIRAGKNAPLRAGGPTDAQSDTVPVVSSAMEKQLGLKLEPAKIPVDILVVDHVEMAPTEN